RFPVREPVRLRSALEHLEAVIALSRETWAFILAETDDDHEWLPNPKQHGVLGVNVRREMIDAWKEFLDEAEEILAGKKLVPHWRVTDGRGINLRRVLTEPRTLDVVLWIQGSAVAPYLERGPVTRDATWDRIYRVFGGQFIG